MKTKSVLFASLAAVAVSLFIPVLSAEPEAGAPERKGPPPGERIEKMKAELGLTDAQAEAIKANMKAQGDAMKAIRDDESLSKDAKRAKVKELRESGRKAMESILTAEQLKKMEEMRKKHEGEGKGERERKGKPEAE